MVDVHGYDVIMVDVHGYDVISHIKWYNISSLSSNRSFAALTFENRNYYRGKGEKILNAWK